MKTISLAQAPPWSMIRSEALRAYQDFEGGSRLQISSRYPILSAPNSNYKLSKQTPRTANTRLFSIFLAPAGVSGFQLCNWRSHDCETLCLNCAGQGQRHTVQDARIRKTLRLMEEPYVWMRNLLEEMEKATKNAAGQVNILRMNGTSDVPWESIAPFVFTRFASWEFYDYTKSLARAQVQPYDLTFSFSGHNWDSCVQLLDSKKARVAVVFDEVPRTYKGYKVINGDADDMRFKDARGVIVGLTYKDVGVALRAFAETTPFIVRREEQ